METSVQNRHQKPLHPLNHQHKEVEVRREKGASEAGVRLGSFLDSRAKITWKVLAPNHLVIIGITPNANSINLNRDVNSVISARLRTGRLRNNQTTSRKRVMTKVQLLIERCTTVGLRFSGHKAAGVFADFTEEHKSLGINLTSAMHKGCAASCKHPRTQRSVARNNSSQTWWTPEHQCTRWAGKTSVRTSKNPTRVVAANGEVQTKEEATENVKQLDLLVTVKLFQDTPAVLSQGKLCEDHGYSFEWTSGQKPQLVKDGRRIKCSTENYEPIVVPGQTLQARLHLHLHHEFCRKQ